MSVRWTEEDYQRATKGTGVLKGQKVAKRGAQQKGADKYGIRGLYAHGVFFGSKKEYNRFLDLKLLEATGEIQNLRFQPTFEFYKGWFRHAKWRLDFSYYDCKSGKRVAEDSTGPMTKEKKRNIKLFREQYSDWELRIT